MSRGVAWRSTKKVWTDPQLLLPSLIFPLFFFVAFAGGLSSVGDAPGFDFPSGDTALQSRRAGRGVGVRRRLHRLRDRADFENGFARRMMLAAPNGSVSWPATR